MDERVKKFADAKNEAGAWLRPLFYVVRSQMVEFISTKYTEVTMLPEALAEEAYEFAWNAFFDAPRAEYDALNNLQQFIIDDFRGLVVHGMSRARAYALVGSGYRDFVELAEAIGLVGADGVITMSEPAWRSVRTLEELSVTQSKLAVLATALRNIGECNSEPPQREVSSSGTGFLATKDGLVLTNAHVVEGAAKIEVSLVGGRSCGARIVAIDLTNDLALLATDLISCAVPPFRLGIRTGESIAVFGFPHFDLLSITGNFTRGDVTALAGLGNDSRMLQITAPIQPGNSGGPLLDQSGNIVGVITSTLRAANLGSVPQNVNFAFKAAIVHTFLEANGVAVEVVGSSVGDTLSAPDLAEAAKKFTVLVTCKQ